MRSSSTSKGSGARLLPVDNCQQSTPFYEGNSSGERLTKVAESDLPKSRRATLPSSGERPYPLVEPVIEPLLRTLRSKQAVSTAAEAQL